MEDLNYLKYDAEVFTPPFRLGKKQQRAVLDSKGKEVVIFPPNSSIQATLYVNYLNEDPNENTSQMKKRIGICSHAFGIEASIISQMLSKNNNVDIVTINDLKTDPENFLFTNPDQYLSPSSPIFKTGKTKKKNNRKGHKRKKAKNGR